MSVSSLFYQMLFGSFFPNRRIAPATDVFSMMASILEPQGFSGIPDVPASTPPAATRFPNSDGGSQQLNPYAENLFALQAQAMAALGQCQILSSPDRPPAARVETPAATEIGEPTTPVGTPATETPTPTFTPGGAKNPSGIGVDRPSGIMELSGFKLMLPTGREGSPDMVQGQDLASHQSPYFRQSNGAITFFSPVKGATSANSDTTRSELGEAQGWRMGAGPRSLSATLSVDKVPSNGKVSVGQLHQRGGSGRPPVMLHWENGRLLASVLQSNSPSARRQTYVLAENIPLGQKFNYNINVAPDGSVLLGVNGRTTRVKLDSSFNDSNMYFKAGVYLQDNQGGSSEGAQATFNALSISKP